MPVTHDEIAALAFQLWKERGEPIGSPEVDWEKAEEALQISSVSLVKTKISENEPDFSATTSGAGDELLAEKTDSVGAEQGNARALNQESATDAPVAPSRNKTIRRRNSTAKQPVSGGSPS